ncbi:uncharacterized protein PV09_07220 [Verruconis gallopava]|uniref:Epoxide hydrolase N-terminal domain-containing protein n=1 Tax=Verruconis gallopava TaxID=253628 RepID=A0A0D2A3S0_9PEZI|nr:uncharacterized protein PV09_07220 [Verruconis gallopava]KIW01463.1 hypothetical protein PV09_07220 [Verruconis gallopava]
MAFDSTPLKAKLQPKPFKAHVSDEELENFKALLKASRIGPKTYENQVSDVKDLAGWGITRDWLEAAKDLWLNRYDWRKTEARINTFNNYTVEIEDGGFQFRIHFVALFSKKADAVPLLAMHGWPGSFLEFLAALDEFRNKYTEDTLPVHVVVPSLPGYGYSNGPPLDRDFGLENAAKLMDQLMVGLGFEDGYIAQGGDLGSFLSRILAVEHPSCKAAHLNLVSGVGPESEAESKEWDPADLKRMSDFAYMGTAYGREHGTRPATIGLVLSSNPIALLAWVGEKFHQWTDQTPPTEEILDSATLYWLTDTFPRSIYPYRQFFGPTPKLFHPDPAYHVKKPLGYSKCPKEIMPLPPKAVARTGNLVWQREHAEGGHFAAMEKPAQFVEDMEEFVREVWPRAIDPGC